MKSQTSHSNKSKTVVLITGCSNGGIGSAFVKSFARHATTQVYATARSLSSMSDLSGLKNVKCRSLDVTSHPDVIAAFLESIVRDEGRLDMLVNNAGLPCPGTLYDQPLDKVRQVFETNVFSVLALCQQVVPIFLTQPSKGKILNVGSIVSDIATPFAGIYCASKSAVQAMTDVMRLEYAELGIQVTLIQPGMIKSQIGKNGVENIHLPGPSSPFAPLRQSVLKRANASQNNPTSAEELADQVVKMAMKSHLPIRFRYGKVTMIFWILSIIPLALVHMIMPFLLHYSKTVKKWW